MHGPKITLCLVVKHDSSEASSLHKAGVLQIQIHAVEPHTLGTHPFVLCKKVVSFFLYVAKT